MKMQIILDATVNEKSSEGSKMSNPKLVYEHMKYLKNFAQEAFTVLTLNTQNELINTHLVTMGTLNSSLVHAREIFRTAILDNANTIIVVHNHPSGNTKPSIEDIKITERLVEAGKLLQIPVLDHIIIGKDFTSLHEEGLVSF